eukprot:scaffold31832_cov15-Tisochrysis_lutea.AAC.1
MWHDNLLQSTYHRTTKISCLDHQQASKLVHKLQGHSVKYAHELVTIRRTIERNNAPQARHLVLQRSCPCRQ